MCQNVVASGQLQLQLLSAKIVNDVDTKSSRRAPDCRRGIARHAYACARRAGIELEPLLKKAGLTDQQIKDRAAMGSALSAANGSRSAAVHCLNNNLCVSNSMGAFIAYISKSEPRK